MDNLLPCPYCGDADRTRIVGTPFTNHNLFVVRCGCGAAGPAELTEAEAIAAWNRRPVNPLVEVLHREQHEQLGQLYQDMVKLARQLAEAGQGLVKTTALVQPFQDMCDVRQFDAAMDTMKAALASAKGAGIKVKG